MPNKSVSCTASSREQARQITHRIRTVHFSGNNISVRFPDREVVMDSSLEKNTSRPEGALAGAALGGVILGWMGWGGALPMPVTGHVVAGFIGALVGVILGGLAGWLIGLGMPERDSGRCEDQPENGKILISVHTENVEEIGRAQEAFAQAGAQDICTTDEAIEPP